MIGRGSGLPGRRYSEDGSGVLGSRRSGSGVLGSRRWGFGTRGGCLGCRWGVRWGWRWGVRCGVRRRGLVGAVDSDRGMGTDLLISASIEH